MSDLDDLEIDFAPEDEFQKEQAEKQAAREAEVGS